MVRHLASNIVFVAEVNGIPQKMIGAIQDVTDQRQAEQELAAHTAVSDALADWEPGAVGALRPVRDLAEALEFDIGVLFVRRGDVLATWVIWQTRALHSPERESELLKLRLTRGEGLAGSAWARRRPSGSPI
jgi:hypothetical protein